MSMPGASESEYTTYLCSRQLSKSGDRASERAVRTHVLCSTCCYCVLNVACCNECEPVLKLVFVCSRRYRHVLWPPVCALVGCSCTVW